MSVRGPHYAHGVLGTPHGEVRNNLVLDLQMSIAILLHYARRFQNPRWKTTLFTIIAGQTKALILKWIFAAQQLSAIGSSAWLQIVDNV